MSNPAQLEPPRHASLATVWSRLLNEPVARGAGVYVYAASGARYLDFTSGIGVVNVGHCHPRVVEAVKQQADKLLFGQMNCVLPETALELVACLGAYMPEGIDAFFLSNSGAEAVEGAVKLARMVSKRPNVIAFQGGFHGRTALAMALTSSKTSYRAGYQPLPAGVFFAPFPRPELHRGDVAAAVGSSLCELETILATQTAPTETAAMILEPVLGEGGYVPAPPEFLQGVRTICDRHGILLVLDEIQTGCGRTGRWWACQHAGVRPDILTIAKGIASGLPLSVIAASDELLRRWPVGSHGGTYGGGSPLTHVAAIATLRTIAEEGLVENAQRQGDYLLAGLQSIAASDPRILDVRGLGLMAACEFPAAGEHAGLATRISQACAKRGLLLLTCGAWSQVVRWIPPLIVTQEQLDEGLKVFAAVLRETA